MQRNIISASIAAALAVAAAPAFALAPSAFSTATASEIYVSGASAQEGQLLNAMRNLCNANTLDVYRQANQFIYFCTANPARVAGLTKPNIVVYKSSVGGSGNGTGPVADSSTLQFMNIATLPTTGAFGCAAATTITTGGLSDYVDHASCTNTLVSKNTQIGVSDVEPNKFLGSVPSLNSTNITRIPPKSINQLIFGVPVTLALRNALQTAQGLASNSETEANMPSLTKTQITSIYTGSLPSPTWDNFGLTNPADPVNAIWVARRVQSSGTQTSARIFFNNDPCTPALASFVEDGSAANNNTASNVLACSSADPLGAGFTTVYQGSGSGNVVTCLNEHNADGRWAVGVLSTEFIGGPDSFLGAGLGNGYRFVKVDGVAPTLYNAAQGRYQYVMEATLQYRTDGSGALGTATFNGGTVADSGNAKKVADAMVVGFNDPSVIALIDTALVHPFGPAGILGVPSAANSPTDPITVANIATNPISAFTKSAAGATENCQPLQAVKSGSKTGFAN